MFRTKVVQNLDTHTLYVQYILFSNRAVYSIKWKNYVELCRPQMTIGPMRNACWISKTTNTHTGCVILITFPLQQWLHERISVLRYTFIASPVFLKVLSTRSILTAAQNQATQPLRVDKY